MNLSLNNLADQFIFWNLKKITHGHLELVDCYGIKHIFGKKDSSLRANIKIKDPAFSSKSS